MSILCYHELGTGWESPVLVTPELFATHIRWLKAHRNLIPLDAAADRIDSTARLPRGFAAVTFDDGFSGLYDHWSLFRGIPVTVFLVAQSLTTEGIDVDWVEKAPTRLQTLSLDQILEMQDGGVRFASHSFAHRNLTEMTMAECERDLYESRVLLEDLLGTHVPFVAYPVGRHNDVVRTAAKRAGYSHGFTLERVVDPSDPLAIPRVGIYGGNGPLALRMKASRSYLRFRPYMGSW